MITETKQCDYIEVYCGDCLQETVYLDNTILVEVYSCGSCV